MATTGERSARTVKVPYVGGPKDGDVEEIDRPLPDALGMTIATAVEPITRGGAVYAYQIVGPSARYSLVQYETGKAALVLQGWH